jgi:hypothetical protein
VALHLRGRIRVFLTQLLDPSLVKISLHDKLLKIFHLFLQIFFQSDSVMHSPPQRNHTQHSQPRSASPALIGDTCLSTDAVTTMYQHYSTFFSFANRRKAKIS